MTTVNDVINRLKDAPQDLKFVICIDGEYYDIKLSDINSRWVIPSKDWMKDDCYQSVDEGTKDAIQVLAIE